MLGSRANGPCRVKGVDCAKRHPGCHSSCPDYKKYKEELEVLRKKHRWERI